jgi:hypothetical protein
MGWEASSILLAVGGGVLPLLRADVAQALRRACAWAPSLPPSSMANGTKTCCPPWEVAIGYEEAISAWDFLSSTCLAAFPGMVATCRSTVFLYTVVTTASMPKCRPSANKFSATTSTGLERSVARSPRASMTIDAYGTPASRRKELMTTTKPEWSKWRIPPFGQRTTWRSRDSSSLAWMPHCGQ